MHMAARSFLLALFVVGACRTAVEEPVVVLPGAEVAVDEPAEANAMAEIEPPLELVEVAPGIHAALQPSARRFADSNAALVVNEAGIVLIDGPQKLMAVDWLRAQADAMTEGSRRVLITTHWHLDHSLGGAYLRAELEGEGVEVEHWGHASLDGLIATEGDAQLIEHRDALPGMVERGEAMRASGRKGDGSELTEDERSQLDEELLRVQGQVEALRGLELAMPTHHASRRTRVELGSMTLELHPMRAHTDADLVIYIAQAKVLITGDVLDEIPFGGHGRPTQWLAALKQLAELEVETIIPGHGALMGPEAIDRAIALWSAIVDQAKLAVERGETPADRHAAWEASAEYRQLRAKMAHDPVGERAFDRFIPDALARAVAELRGEI